VRQTEILAGADKRHRRLEVVPWFTLYTFLAPIALDRGLDFQLGIFTVALTIALALSEFKYLASS